MGSEGSGLRASVRAACTAVVAVPMALDLIEDVCGSGAAASGGEPPLPLLESLNVSVAAALLLQKLMPRH